MSTIATFPNGGASEGTYFLIFTSELLYSGGALLAYSHLISIGEEIEYIWKQPFGLSGWLYLLIRYPGLLSQLIAVGINSYTPGCNKVIRMAEAMITIAMTSSYAFQVLSSYAVCGKKWQFSLLLVFACLPAVAGRIWKALMKRCNESPGYGSVLQDRLVNCSEMAFETIVLAMTVWKTWSLVVPKAGSSRDIAIWSLPRALLQNGVLYYCVLVTLDVGVIVFQNAPQSSLNSTALYIFYSMNSPIRWSILSHFLLQLRRRALDFSDTDHLSPSLETSIQLPLFTKQTWPGSS